MSKDHEMPCIFHLAGRNWIVPSLTMAPDIEGDLSLSLEDIRKAHLSIANEIIREKKRLTPEEFAFLCEISEILQNEVADVLHCKESTISKWKARARFPELESLILKEFVWDRLFLEKVSDEFIVSVASHSRPDERVLAKAEVANKEIFGGTPPKAA